MTIANSTVALELQADPTEVGFDAGRLARIDRHLDRYVKDGRLPGWMVVVSREGRIAHVGRSGRRDIEADLPVEPDTLWRIYSMTKPITSVAAMMLWEEGAFELKDEVARFLPEFADARVHRRLVAEAGHRARHRADARLAPADPHLRDDLRLPLCASGRRDLPRARLRVGDAAGARSRRVLCRLGADAAALPARQRVELLGLHRRARPPRRGRLRPVARRVLRRADLRAAGDGR